MNKTIYKFIYQNKYKKLELKYFKCIIQIKISQWHNIFAGFYIYIYNFCSRSKERKKNFLNE